MSEPTVTFYFTGDLPAHVSVLTDAGEEIIKLSAQFKVSDPGHIAILEQLAANPYHGVSRTAPRKDEPS